MNLESASARADQIARQFLAFGEVPAIGTLIGKIDAVSKDQVRDLARQLFKSQTPAFSAVGHIDTLSDYTTLVKQHLREASMAFLKSPFAPDPPPGAAGTAHPPAQPGHGRLRGLVGRCAAQSRDFLAPWEPLWPANDLTRTAFRLPHPAVSRAISAMTWPIPSSSSRRDEKTLLGALTLSNVRRGVAQMATLGYWIGAPFARQGYMTDAPSGAAALCLRSPAPAPRGGRLPAAQRGLDCAAAPRPDSSRKAWPGAI